MRPRLAIALLFLVLGCGGDGVSAPEAVTITTEGGTITSADGKVTLVVPAGALAQPTAITITPAPASADARLVPGTEYVFEPDGLTFALPARLTIRYDSIPAAMADRADWVWLHRRAGSGWTPMAGQPVNIAARTITGEITGFSSFGGVISQLAADLLEAGLLLDAFLTDAIAENAIALLAKVAAILQQQQDPAFQALAQPFLAAMGTTACNAYASAIGNARSSPVDDWGVLTELLAPMYAWAAVVQETVPGGSCANAPLTFDQLQTLKFQQFVDFYVAKLDPAAIDQSFERVVQEIDFVLTLRSTVQQLGLTASDDRLEAEAQHPLLDRLRLRAYQECRSQGRHHHLGRLRTVVSHGTYTDDDLITDLQHCATRLTWRVTAPSDPSLNANGSLGGGPAPGTQAEQATTPGIAEGTIRLDGDVRAFRCPDGSFAPDQLVVRLAGVEVHRRSASGGAFLSSPLQLDAKTILETAGVDPGQTAAVPLVAARESTGCGLYVQLVGEMPIATLRLQYPAPQVVYQNDFSSAAGAAWSFQTLANSPSGERFLGELAAGEVSLGLSGLPAHAKVKVEFDLYLIRSWDGSNTEPGNGPDILTVTLDGATLLHTTFSNVNGVADHRQAYPDAYPDGDHAAGTGAAAINSLGYTQGSAHHNKDSTYRLVFEVDHASASLMLRIAAQNLSPFPDEYWGIDNVKVSVK